MTVEITQDEVNRLGGSSVRGWEGAARAAQLISEHESREVGQAWLIVEAAGEVVTPTRLRTVISKRTPTKEHEQAMEWIALQELIDRRHDRAHEAIRVTDLATIGDQLNRNLELLNFLRAETKRSLSRFSQETIHSSLAVIDFRTGMAEQQQRGARKPRAYNRKRKKSDSTSGYRNYFKAKGLESAASHLREVLPVYIEVFSRATAAELPSIIKDYSSHWRTDLTRTFEDLR